MFNRKTQTEKTGLQEEIQHLLDNLSDTDPFEDNYAIMVDQLVKLYPLQDTDRPKRVSPDVAATIAGNVLVTSIIVAYEQKHVIATKAKDFWTKLR